MERLKTAFNNNRSRVAGAAGVLGDAVIYILCDALGISTDTAHLIAASWTAYVTAYIIGNGKYEAATAVLDTIPPPPDTTPKK